MPGAADAGALRGVPSPSGPASRAALAALLLAVGCSTARPVPTDTAREWLPFLHDGTTTTEEVLLELGVPTAQFEGERILTYRLLVKSDGKVVPINRHLRLAWDDDPRLKGWPEASVANLVLVFDERHVLVKHRFIEVR